MTSFPCGRRCSACCCSRLETKLNALAEARGELKLTIPMAYVEAVRVTED